MVMEAILRGRAANIGEEEQLLPFPILFLSLIPSYPPHVFSTHIYTDNHTRRWSGGRKKMAAAVAAVQDEARRVAVTRKT